MLIMIRTIINRNVPHLKNTSKDMFMKRNIITRKVSSLEQNSKEKLATEYLLEKKYTEIFLLKYFGTFSVIGLVTNYSLYISERGKKNARYKDDELGFMFAMFEGTITGGLFGFIAPFCLVGSVLYIPILIYDKVKNKEKAV